MLENSHPYNSIIALNGSDLYPLDSLNWSKKIIAVDGAFKNLKNMGLKIDHIVGDLDSISKEIVNSEYKQKLHHDPDQNTSDFEKAIKFARHMSLTPSVIVGINGKEIDHILNNVHVMVKHHQYDGEFVFIDSQSNGSIKLGMVLSKSKLFRCGIGKTVSIFPFPSATLTTHGLEYPLSMETIVQCSGVLCVRNKSASDEIEIVVHNGLILVTLDVF